jgi:hypothetical protein
MEQIGALARQAGATTFVIDPRGLTTNFFNPSGASGASADWLDYVRNTQDSLKALATLTGGNVIADPNSSFFSASYEDVYYELTYRPASSTGTQAKALGVQVKRRGLTATIK